MQKTMAQIISKQQQQSIDSPRQLYNHHHHQMEEEEREEDDHLQHRHHHNQYPRTYYDSRHPHPYQSPQTFQLVRSVLSTMKLSACIFTILFTLNQIHQLSANPMVAISQEGHGGLPPSITDLDEIAALNADRSLLLPKSHHNYHRQHARSAASMVPNEEDEDVMLSGSIPRIIVEDDMEDGQTNKAAAAAAESEGIAPDSQSFMDNMMLMMANQSDERVVRLNPKDCIFVKTEEGVYQLVSEDDSTMVCGLYLMANPNQLIEIEFLQFNVTCHNDGLLSVVNGWELMGQFFPSVQDHPVPRDQRYQEFCGEQQPLGKVFRMSQNVGLIEYRIPTPGQGFTVRIRFIENPKPCNTIVQLNYGIYTLKNYGRRINCTMSVLDVGATFRILSMNVGQSYRRLDNIIHSPRNHVVETGVIKKCKKRGMEDYVEFRGGNGLDTQLMQVGDDVCGFRQFPYKKRFTLLCTNTAVRMVSSGNYDNQIEFSFETILEPDTEQQPKSPLSSPPSLICPKPSV